VPLSYLQYAGNGTNRTFAVSLSYLSRTHVKVYTGYDFATGIGTELLSNVGFTWLSDTSVQTTVAPANGAVLTIIRQTPSTSRLVVWSAGSPPTPTELNTSDLQNLYVIQEQQDRNDVGIAQSTAAKDAVDAVIVAVASSVVYVAVATVAAIPSSPGDNDFIEISNSTGLESFIPLAGRPVGFVGDSGLTVRLRYSATTFTWIWISYNANNSDARYQKAGAPLSSSTFTGPVTLIAGSVVPGYLTEQVNTITATSKTLANRERCTVTAAGQTITLPASPAAGWEVSIANASGGTDTVIARNSANIMSFAENMTLDVSNVTVTLYYVDATRGWRII
jgi:hypothetical protein